MAKGKGWKPDPNSNGKLKPKAKADKPKEVQAVKTEHEPKNKIMPQDPRRNSVNQALLAYENYNWILDDCVSEWTEDRKGRIHPVEREVNQ